MVFELFRVSFLDRSLLVNCPKEVSDYLLRVSAPYYRMDKIQIGDRDTSILFILKPRSIGHAVRAAANPRSIRHHESTAVVQGNGDSGCVEVANPSVIYEWRKHEDSCSYRFELSCNELTVSVLIEIFRFVRGYLQKALENAGFVKAHCAAFTTASGTACIVGPSGAGKTSFLMSALSNGTENAFITNDKAFLAEKEGSKIALFGAPYAISVCREIAESSPLFISERKIGDEYYHWPSELGSRLPFAIETKGVVALICQVEFKLNESLSMVDVEDHAERDAILDVLMACPDKMVPQWLPTFPHEGMVEQERSRARIKALSSFLPIVRISGDPWLCKLDLEKVVGSYC